MNYSVIFAGGVGSRMNSKSVPKQFLEINGKPILIHTLEHFENHDEIDAICVVCVETWLEQAKELINKYNLKKIKWIVAGGTTALESQFIGLKEIQSQQKIFSTDVVLIHDGVRPLIDGKLVSDCIASVKLFGSAITVSPAIETIVCVDSNNLITTALQRDECRLARAPQAFRLMDILNVHLKERECGNYDYVDSASMMIANGYKLHVVTGPSENIKITNPADYYITRALLEERENSRIFGI